MLSPLDLIQIAAWLNDFMTPPLSSGEIPDFIKDKNKNQNKTKINNISNTSVGDAYFQYNTANNLYFAPKTFYTTNVTNVVAATGNLPNMPPRLLPEIIPVATPTDPPNKPILSVQESYAKKQFGRLLYSPISDTTEEIIIIDADSYLTKYKSETKLAGIEHKQWLEYSIFNKEIDDFIPSWDKGCALINSFNKKLTIQSGIKNIEYFRQFYSESSKMSLQFAITGIIPKEYTFETIKLNTSEIETTEQNLESIGINTLNSKLGGFLFPFNLPTYLLNVQTDDPTIENGELTAINNAMDLVKWAIINLDILIGEFPIKLEIDDVNPLNANQTEKVKIRLPNIAESLAEIYGLATLATQNSNTNLALMTNVIPEIVGIKNLGVVNQDFIKAIASYLGFKMGSRKIEYKTNFNPDNPKNWNELITPNRDVIINGIENKSDETISEYLANLMYVASLQKQALLTRNKDLDKNEILKEILNKKGNIPDINPDDFTSDNGGLSDADQTWVNFIHHINKDNSSFNVENGKKTPFKPKVDKHKKL